MTTDGSASAMDSMQLIASLFALLPIPIAVTDKNGGIVLSNSSFSEAFPNFDGTAGMSQREVHSPGHGIFELHTLPLNNQGFSIIYAADVTAQTMLGKQLAELEKMAAVGRGFTGIAQELNNPLADVLDYVPMVERCSMDATARSIVDVVFTNAERAGHMVQNALVLAGTTEPRHVPIDLNEIVRNVMAQRAARNPALAAVLASDLESNLPRSLGVPAQLEQVIGSLMAHSEDAIAGSREASGFIQVQTGRRAGRILVQIADNGIARDSGRLFTPGSTGLGLNVCAEIAKDHGGDLYAWSPNGNGSTYTLELPVSGQESIRTSNSVQLGQLLQNKSVLVVDGDLQIAELIGDVLSRHGARVQIAGSCVDACERLDDREYDLIIYDQVMPGLNGESLYQLVRSEKREKCPLFLFMTGEAISVEARRFYAQAGVQYLRKPFRIQDLVDAIEGLLSRNPPPGF